MVPTGSRANLFPRLCSGRRSHWQCPNTTTVHTDRKQVASRPLLLPLWQRQKPFSQTECLDSKTHPSPHLRQSPHLLTPRAPPWPRPTAVQLSSCLRLLTKHSRTKTADRRIQHSTLTTPSPQPRNSHTELQPTAPRSGAALQHVLRVDITWPAMTLHHRIEPPVSNSPECVSSPRLSLAANTPAQPTHFHHILHPHVTSCLTSCTNHCKKQSHHNHSTNLLPRDRFLLRLTDDS